MEVDNARGVTVPVHQFLVTLLSVKIRDKKWRSPVGICLLSESVIL